MPSLKSMMKNAQEIMGELEFCPITALVEIARNRNNIADVRVKAAVSLLPYAHAPIPITSKLEIKDGTGVMKTPGTVTEEQWSQAVSTLATAVHAARSTPQTSEAGGEIATKH